jgi:hypothetical protein
VDFDYHFTNFLAAPYFSFNGRGEPKSVGRNSCARGEFHYCFGELSPTDFDLSYSLAKQMTRTKSAKEYFEYDRRFWDIIFEKAQRPILWEVFR